MGSPTPVGGSPDRRAHWDDTYVAKVDDVSWFEPDAASSWRVVRDLVHREGVSLVDVGAGSSRLVDRLHAEGVTDVTLLDLSASALAQTAARLQVRPAPALVTADVLAWRPDRTFDIWHDRAVFHFLTERADRSAYRATLLHALAPDGVVVLGTFGADGPEQCSGLPVCRYSPDELAVELGEEFRVTSAFLADHTTPWGAIQHFTWVTAVRA